MDKSLARRVRSRKFLLTVAILLGAAVMIATGTKIDAELASLVKWVVGLYFAGNVGKAGVDRLTEKAAA
jgi:hypothetical protein